MSFIFKSKSYLFSIAVSLTSAFFSDRYASRGIAIILVAILAVTGFAIFLSEVALSLTEDVSLLISSVN